MSIEEISRYRTSDGKEFTDRVEAESHEKELDRLAERAKLPWLDRREYDLEYRLETLRRKNTDQQAEMWNHVAKIMRFKPETKLTAEVLADWSKTAGNMRDLCSSIAYGFDHIQEAERLLADFRANRERLAAESKDKDGTCQYEYYYRECGKPTVEGTCWCEDHIDLWCERHGSHLVETNVEAYTRYNHCAKCL